MTLESATQFSTLVEALMVLPMYLQFMALVEAYMRKHCFADSLLALTEACSLGLTYLRILALVVKEALRAGSADSTLL